MLAQEISTPTVDPFIVIVQCEHFCDVIEGKTPARVDAADAAKTLDATLAVLDSARTGERVDLH